MNDNEFALKLARRVSEILGKTGKLSVRGDIMRDVAVEESILEDLDALIAVLEGAAPLEKRVRRLEEALEASIDCLAAPPPSLWDLYWALLDHDPRDSEESC